MLRHMLHIRRTYYQWSNPRFQSMIADGIAGLKSAHQNTTPSKESIGDPTELSQLVSSNFSSIDFAFGYGSGVVKQSGYSAKEAPQIDLIFAVDNNSAEWHNQNLRANPSHYSGLKYFGGGRTISYVQRLGAGVYFNPYIPIDGNLIKYGVVSNDDILRDLSEWSNLYIAGRLQKPVKILPTTSSLANQANAKDIELANEYNLQSALHLAILLLHSSGKKALGESIETQLFETITSLSYLGDFRMIIGGENPNKIKNIVSKQIPRFRTLYEPILEPLYMSEIINPKTGVINLTQQDVYDNINSLPLNFRKTFYKRAGVNDDIHYLDNSIRLGEILSQTIKSIVRYPSIMQMIKGLVTAGAVKSVKYAWEKKKKNIKKN